LKGQDKKIGIVNQFMKGLTHEKRNLSIFAFVSSKRARVNQQKSGKLIVARQKA